MKVELELDNMSCNHCKMAVEQALKAVDQITDSQVEIGRAVISMENWDTIKVQVGEALEEEGYPVKAVLSLMD